MVRCASKRCPFSRTSAPSPSGQPQKATKDCEEVLVPSRCGPMGGVGESARRRLQQTALQGMPMLLTCSTIGWSPRTVLLYGPCRSHMRPLLSLARFSSRRSTLVRYPFRVKWCRETSSTRRSIAPFLGPTSTI